MAAYPKRDSHFAHKFTRILHKSCACQDVGRDTVLLLIFIAHTEDAARYSGPVRFWNSQLSETMGFRSPKQLNEARKRAIDAGWLQYRDRGTRIVGEYYVTIPAQYRDVNDDALYDESDASILSADGTNNGTNNGTKAERIAERIAESKRNELRNEGGTNCGKPSIPTPIPDPSPSLNTPPNPQGGTADTKPPRQQKRPAKTPYVVEDQTYPLALDTEAFRAAWQTWTVHRTEIGKPMTPLAASKTLAKCESLGSARAIAAIDHSIANGWQGLFEPQATNGNGNGKGPLGYDPDPRGTFAAAKAWMDSKKQHAEDAEDGQH